MEIPEQVLQTQAPVEWKTSPQPRQSSQHRGSSALNLKQLISSQLKSMEDVHFMTVYLRQKEQSFQNKDDRQNVFGEPMKAKQKTNRPQ